MAKQFNSSARSDQLCVCREPKRDYGVTHEFLTSSRNPGDSYRSLSVNNAVAREMKPSLILMIGGSRSTRRGRGVAAIKVIQTTGTCVSTLVD